MNNTIIICILLLFVQKNNAAINPKNSSFDLKKYTVVVAVIDTGVDISHKDLEKYIWVNAGETGKDYLGRDKATNRLDDDDNGFIDDLHGWNFVDNNNNVTDLQGHGTHIAGIITKEFKKHNTSHALRSSARLMILKYYDSRSEDSQNILNTVNALNYAVKMKAHLINYSGGGASPYLPERLVIEKAAQKNILLVAAAGNNNVNTDSVKYYPANYELDNIISVAAANNDGELVSFSNYGHTSVDIAAPGKLIFSALPKNSYGLMSGTSQATAFVTGVAASLLAKNNILKPKEILTSLLVNSKFNKSLKGKTKFQMAMVQNGM